MEINTIEIRVEMQDWGTMKWKDQLVRVLKEEDIRTVQKHIRAIKTEKFEDRKNVYFHKSAVFPRRKFKIGFPNSKLVTKLESADIVIIDRATLLSDASTSVPTITYYPLFTKPGEIPRWTANTSHSSQVPGASPERFTSHYWTNESVTVFAAKYNELLKLATSGKKFVDITDLFLPSEQRLDQDAFEKINKMLDSGDDALRNMGINLLTAYDLSKDGARVALLLSMNWAKWTKQRNKKINVEAKYMLRKIKLEFPEYDRYGDSGVNAFWLRLVMTDPDDPVINKAFNLWVKRIIPEAPEIKITRI